MMLVVQPGGFHALIIAPVADNGGAHAFPSYGGSAGGGALLPHLLAGSNPPPILNGCRRMGGFSPLQVLLSLAWVIPKNARMSCTGNDRVPIEGQLIPRISAN